MSMTLPSLEPSRVPPIRSQPAGRLLKASQMLSSTDGWTLAEVAADRLNTASLVMMPAAGWCHKSWTWYSCLVLCL